MTKDLVSVIIPCYNVSPWLDDLFASLNKQTYKNFEVIFVNDGSTDNTLQKLTEYCEREFSNAKIIDQKNQGVSAARNAGLAIANGEFVVFFDPDDFLLPHYLETLHKFIGKFDCAFCQSYVIKEKAAFKQKPSKKAPVLTVFSNNSQIMDFFFTENQYFSPANKMYKTELLKKMNGFPNVFNPAISYAEDFDFNYRYLCNIKNVVIISEKLYVYRIRRGSALHSKFNMKNLSSLIAVDSNFEHCQQHYPHCVARLRQLRIAHTIGNLMQMRLHGHASYDEVYPLVEYLDNNIKYSLSKSFKICYPLMRFVFFHRILKKKRKNR